MSSRPYATPLELRLGRAPLLRLLYLALHLAALVVAPLIDAGPWLAAPLTLLVFGVGLYGWRSDPALGGPAEVWLWQGDDLWYDDQGRAWRLQPNRFRSPWLCVLALRLEGASGWHPGYHLSRLVTPYSVGGEAHRRLRVRLMLPSPPDREPPVRHG